MDSSLQPCEIKAISNILLMRKQTGDVICLRPHGKGRIHTLVS